MIIPNHKVHMLFAGILGYLVFNMFHLGNVFDIAVCVVGGLFPDCDHPKAPMGKVIPAWLFVKHRGATHSLWCLLLLSYIVAFFISLPVSLYFAIGYFSHLLLDSTTPSGVKWWG